MMGPGGAGRGGMAGRGPGGPGGGRGPMMGGAFPANTGSMGPPGMNPPDGGAGMTAPNLPGGRERRQADCSKIKNCGS